ncbi:WD40 repeat domain-containing protein [Hyphomicrobiales bacterium]|nr:WD40 repeat domain-containing protein [Hyphomicrobiales bacterium]CAH1698550.1 WD40 repeat domain-containing protein [Hyphomicrobiales bacterium]CAI0342198.1 WD40 repeat domain-containing protein [Hyphomicrobiales bacterium]
MTTMTPPVSLREHVTPIAAETHVVAARWLKQGLALALADGRVLRWRDGAVVDSVEAHAGGILCATGDGERLISGGDDGRVVATRIEGEPEELAKDPKRRWIDAITLSASGNLAWNTGKTVQARDEKGRIRTLEAASTPQGLVFAPKGYRLAIAQMNGVSLWYPNTEAKPEFLEWKGSHLDVAWSPDGRFVVSSMQENALHGWRLGDKPSHMRMTGYPAKPRSLSWSHDGLWLASSGADGAIVWPFQGDGPQGKAPRECGVRHARVTRVAFHPGALVLAIGYDDGCILLVRLTDGSELLVRPAERGSGISAFAWDKAGKWLAFGAEDGAAGVLVLPS